MHIAWGMLQPIMLLNNHSAGRMEETPHDHVMFLHASYRIWTRQLSKLVDHSLHINGGIQVIIIKVYTVPGCWLKLQVFLKGCKYLGNCETCLILFSGRGGSIMFYICYHLLFRYRFGASDLSSAWYSQRFGAWILHLHAICKHCILEAVWCFSSISSRLLSYSCASWSKPSVCPVHISTVIFPGSHLSWSFQSYISSHL